MRTLNPIATAALIALTASATTIAAAPAKPTKTHPLPTRCCPAPNQHTTPVIDVVFVLDTTGSMGGLIEGAKQKIWSIANQIAQTENTPRIRMGLVGYRDRNDAYITRKSPLTTDLDKVHTDLHAFKAQGGGDTPESVNQALHEAVNCFDWSTQKNALKIIYLVGDAPPHTDYDNDTPYYLSCKHAMDKGISIQTIQCGNINNTKPIWEEIAFLADGQYLAIQHTGGMKTIDSPYDQQISELGKQLDANLVPYGSREEITNQNKRIQQSRDLAARNSAYAEADR